MSAKGAFETGRGGALPDRLEYVAFYPDRPGRPGTGKAMAEAIVAFSAAARGEDNRLLAFGAKLGAMMGGATVVVEERPAEALLKVCTFNLPDGPVQVPIGAAVAEPDVLRATLALFHRGGRVSTWSVR